ncbi:MAG: rod shape-determining protein RodA [Deltaproteobacteria bacterium]|nr:rod shape-determining protein RodA [Deltaproteobacteria bacterium]
MFDRRLVQYFDWGLLGLVVLLAGCGLTTLYSAVTAGGTAPHTLYVKQLMWYGIGFAAMIVSFLISYKSIEKWADVIYAASNGLLLAVLIFGKLAGGSKRWLILGPISIQPSEIAKVAVIIVLARYYSQYANERGMTLKGLITPVVYTLVPFVLIVKQPDLGTAMLIVLIAASVTIFVKIERRTFVGILVTGMVSVPLVWFFLKGYQKQRILTFLNPDRDPLGAGYHIIQSKIAIGSGMIGGKGFLKGTQNALSFLPEQHTDFIFSVLAEEWGFLGSSVLLILFLLLILWGLNVAYGCRDNFGTILAVGVTALIAWQVLINIGMVMGLMPVVGVPLPFVSYGGSSIVTMMVCIGILMNISMRRFMFEKS